MNVKIERVNKDIEKMRAKISDMQGGLRELERRKTELENTEIVDIVRGMDISLAELAAMLKGGGVTSGQVDPKPAPPAKPAIPTNTDMEDNDNEEE